jgi:hypothetical protein
METDEAVTVEEIANAAERAFEYQRYIARRGFGLYFLAWAAAILFINLSTNLSALAGLTGDAAFIFGSVANLLALVAAACATILIVRDARRTAMVSRALGWRQGIYARYGSGLILGIYVAVTSAYLLAPSLLGPLFYAILLPVPFLLYIPIRAVFPDRRPVEILVAIAVYGATAAISFVLSLAGAGSWAIGWAWVATSMVWFLAAFYALYRAPDELEALRS